MRCYISPAATFAIALAISPSATVCEASLVTSIEPTGSWIRQDNPNDSPGIQPGDDGVEGSDIFFLGSVNGTANFRSIMSLDLSSLPAGSQISAISLTMVAQKDGNSDLSANNFDVPLTLQRLTVTPEYSGTVPTWNNYTDSQTWTTPGGDFSAPVLASSDQDMNLNTVETGDIFTFSSTNELVAAAQDAFDADETLDLMLRAPGLEDVSGRTLARFNGPGKGSNAGPPIFTVTYAAIPEPTMAPLFASVIATSWLVRARRR